MCVNVLLAQLEILYCAIVFQYISLSLNILIAEILLKFLTYFFII